MSDKKIVSCPHCGFATFNVMSVTDEDTDYSLFEIECESCCELVYEVASSGTDITFFEPKEG